MPRSGTGVRATTSRQRCRTSKAYRPRARPSAWRVWAWLDPDTSPVGGGLGLVPDIAWLPHHPPPARELQEDPVGILEVERADEDAGMQLARYAELAVIVAEYGADPHSLGLQLVPVLQELLFRDVESHVVHRADRTSPFPKTGHGHGRGDARHGVRRIREPEEGQRISAAH